MSETRRVGVIDIGTVTARVGMADIRDHVVLSIVRESRICNLGEGVDAAGLISPDAIARVLEAVDGFIAFLRAHRCDVVGCFLTSSARDARNADELLDALRARGLAPEVLTGTVEGALAFRGVAQAFDCHSMAVADIGGGSTELTCGGRTDDGLVVDWTHSFDLGARRLTERFLSRNDPPSRDDLVACCCETRMAFEAQMPWMEGALAHPDILIATGGTVTSLSAMRLGLETYDSAVVQGSALTVEEVDDLGARLAAMTESQRARIPGLQPNRAPVILGGTLLVGELMRASGFRELTVSDFDGLAGACMAVERSLDGTPGPVGFLPATVGLADLVEP